MKLNVVLGLQDESFGGRNVSRESVKIEPNQGGMGMLLSFWPYRLLDADRVACRSDTETCVQSIPGTSAEMKSYPIRKVSECNTNELCQSAPYLSVIISALAFRVDLILTA